MDETVLTRSEDDTVSAGRALGTRLSGGTTVLLYGELGAGKTAFVRGLALGLDIDPADVSSPTFTLVQQYRGRLTLYHVDLYRLSPKEADELGLEEMGGAAAIMAIEWADRLADRLRGDVSVTIEAQSDDTRRITIREADPAPYSRR